MFGLSVDTLRNIREAFARLPSIEKVLLYGSRAKGNYQTGSDIDITLIGKNLTLDNTIYPLQDALDKLYLPHTFDICIFNQLDEPAFIDHILRVGKTFYERKSGVMDGWEAVPLSQCLQRIDTPKKIPRKQYENSGRFPIVSQERDLINGYWSDENDVIYVNSPLVVFGDHTQTLKYIDFDFVVGADGVKLLQPKAFLNPKYFYYFLIGHPVDSLGYARHFRLIKEHKVVFPKSLSEQERIVAILDEAFAAIATATTNTKTNLANARELFESQLERAFTDNAESEEWTHKPLGEVCRVVNGGTPKTKVSEYWEGPHAWITPAEMGGLDSPFMQTTRRTLTDEGLGKCTASLLPEYSVVLSTRAPIGHIIINEIPMATNQGCRGLIPCNQLHYKFLYYFLSSKIRLLNNLGTGTTFKELSATKLKGVSLSLPPLPKQERIVAILDKLSADTQSLSDTYNTKLNALAELKQSLLHQAFSGALTADANAADRSLSEAGMWQ